MTLLDLHVELAVTNQLLARIADALDRAHPVADPFAKMMNHPLIGANDISRMSPERAAAVDDQRTRHPLGTQYARDFRPSQTTLPGGPGVEGEDTIAQTGPPRGQASSITGAWDHEDPLDLLDDGYQNYAGVDTR